MNNRLILGTVQMGLNYGVNNTKGRMPEAEAFLILDNAFEQGINTLDTAEVYGNSHELIGDFHKRNKHSIFKVITKLPKDNNYLAAEKVDQYCNELGVSEIEVLMFHDFDSYFSGNGILDDLEKLKKENKIKSIGVSVYTNEQAEIVINNSLIDVIQIPFNLLDNLNKRGALLAMAEEKGKLIHTRSAFLQGLFFLGEKSLHPAYLVLEPYLNKIHKIAAKHHIAVYRMALLYCLLKKEIGNVLIGVDSLQHLYKNLDYRDHVLLPEAIAEIEGINVKEEEWLNPTKWN